MRFATLRGGGLALGLLVVAVLVLARVGRAAPKAAHGTGPATVDATGAAADVLQRSRDYRSWQRFAEYAKPRPSKAHSGNHVVAWYNAPAAPAAKSGAREYPDGSILVKENRVTPDGEPGSLSVMAKRAGSWFWISASPDWKVFTADGAPLAGDLGRCAGCHGAADRDMVFSR